MKLMQLFRSQSGSVIPVIGVLVAALIGSSGAAIDTGRGQLVKAKLSSSLDAAGLAASATVNTVSLQSEMTKYLNANFNGYMGASIKTLSIVPNANNTVFELAATAELPTTFMQIMGIDKITVRAESQVTRASTGLELVMVLDNTLSMQGSKLTSLKTASNQLLGILFGNQASIPNLWVGIVPFNNMVNVGPSHTGWLAANNYPWHNIDWAGCVDAREANSRDVTDDPPAVAKFPQFYWPDDGENDWLTNGGSVRSGIGTGKGPNRGCPQEVTRLTNVKADLVDDINSMYAIGSTHINLGAVWGWRMLSERWQGLWGGTMGTTMPLNYNTPKMSKAIIIMTDGDNYIDNTYRGGYWYLDSNKLNTKNQSTAEGKLDTRLGQVCTSMKNKNIIVYTVSFGSISDGSKTMLRNCATQTDFYFHSPDGTTLQNAFKAIGDSLSSLRVTR